MKVQKKMKSIKKGMPADRTWALVVLKDLVSGLAFLKSCFYEKGHFWDTASENAHSIEVSEGSAPDYKANLVVTHWCLNDL